MTEWGLLSVDGWWVTDTPESSKLRLALALWWSNKWPRRRRVVLMVVPTARDRGLECDAAQYTRAAVEWCGLTHHC